MLGFEIYDDSVSVGYNMRQTIIGMGWSFSRSKLEDLRRGVYLLHRQFVHYFIPLTRLVVSLQDMFARKTHKVWPNNTRDFSEILLINTSKGRYFMGRVVSGVCNSSHEVIKRHVNLTPALHKLNLFRSASSSRILKGMPLWCPFTIIQRLSTTKQT